MSGAPDVVIVGAGMPGATLALALTQAGLTAVLVDPAPFEVQCAPAFDGRASAISFAAFRQWRALGAGPLIAPHAQRIEQILVTDGRAPGASSRGPSAAFLRFDAAEIADRTEGEPLGYMVENRHIRAGLAQAVGAAGVEVLAPAKVVEVATDGSRARVVLADGRSLTAPLIVGADGRGSLVRKAGGIDTFGWSYGATAVVAAVGVERDHEGVAHEHFLPGGPFAILPLTERRASLVWTEKPARAAALAACSPEAFEAHLALRFGPFLGRARLQGARFTYPLSLLMALRLTGERIALVGDAGHAIHPIAGQGLNMGLKDCAALAEVVSEAARLGEDIGAPAVLARYERWRRLDNIAVAAATDVFNRLYSTSNPLVRAARDAGMAAVNRIGPARRLFMAEAGGALGDLPRLLRGQALG
jgi:2-octaprenyl-6-methoxyphenol hydroxylase